MASCTAMRTDHSFSNSMDETLPEILRWIYR